MELHFKDKAYIVYKNIKLLQNAVKLNLIQDAAIRKKINYDLSFINVVITNLHTFIANNALFVERNTYALLLHHVVVSFISLLQYFLDSFARDTAKEPEVLKLKITAILKQQSKFQDYLENIQTEHSQDEKVQFGASEPELQMLIQDFSID